MIDFSVFVPVIAVFFILAVASKQFGDLFSRARLPLITGFLFTGIAVGPSILGLISTEAVTNLRFVDQVSLAVIAFAAGAELHLKELRRRFKSIGWITSTHTLFIFSMGSISTFLLGDLIPFLSEMPPVGRIAVAILGGTILVARSPSSAIAIVTELRAKGPFTQTTLGVTMITDVIVIVLFAINSSIAASLISGGGIDFVLAVILTGEIIASIFLGFALGKTLGFVLGARFYRAGKIGLVLLLGYGVFLFSDYLHEYSQAHLSFRIFLEPLLICMVAGFTVTNFTRRHRNFERVLSDVGPPVFVAFFTLTGASLDLEVLKATWMFALILASVRLLGLFLGSVVGGAIAGDTPRQNRLAFMAHITQAGVGLGLAKEVAVKFPGWGEQFATTIIAVIIINQIAGPPFFKWAIELVKEAHNKPKTEPEPYDGVRDAVIFGLENNAYFLARQLASRGWQVKIATRKLEHVKAIPDPLGFVHYLPDLSLEALKQIEVHRAEAVVTMYSNDDDSLEVCRTIRENFDIQDLVVRVNDIKNLERFRKLDALAVEPTSAFINLLDHLVRAPAATSLIMGIDDENDVIDLELRDPSLEGMLIHELRLPFDVIIVSLNRQGETIAPHGDTELALGDCLTLIGPPDSLEKAALMFDVDFPVRRPTGTFPIMPVVEPRGPRGAKRLQLPFVWDQYLDVDLMRARLEVDNKEDLFREIAKLFARAHIGDATELENAFWDREHRQDTLVGDGLAIPHVMAKGLDRTHLGVVTLTNPIDYGDGEHADVIIFMLGPLEDRQNYLKLLANTAAMCAKTDLLEKLRGAASSEQLREVLLVCHQLAEGSDEVW